MTDCCKKFPDYSSLSKYLSNLYDASLESSTVFGRWDQRSTVINASILDNRYALEGEDLEAEMCRLICECLLEPKTENGAFDESVTALMRTELTDTIDSVINDKSAYAKQNANKTVFKGEPQELSVNGTHEEAEKVTPQTAYNAYKKILETGHVEIIGTGSSTFSTAEKIFTQMFTKINRHDVCELSAAPSPLKDHAVYVNDTLPMQQAILRMYFKTKEKITDRPANMLFSLILGGMTTSRFFMNIREKQSLCYYCGCNSDRLKQTLSVVSGVEPSNAERVREAVSAELKDICENGVTEEEIKAAKLEVRNQVSALYDSAAALGTWYLNQILDDKIQTPEEYLEEVQKVDGERIAAAARLYSLDTVYTLTGGDGND